MNVVFIVTDTLRRDHVSAYGVPDPWSNDTEACSVVQTPHIDRLAATGTIFDRCYLTSYPTIPWRRDFMTGRIWFPVAGWQPLEPDDVVLAGVLRRNQITSMLVFDTPALLNDSANYTRGFTGWDWVRGQHSDRWSTDPIDLDFPAMPHKLKPYRKLRNYLLNSARWEYEHDWPCRRTAKAACEWLERNVSRDSFFLCVDTWDPHEPFDAPPGYLNRHVPSLESAEPVIYPRYGRVDYMSAAELTGVRARYAAKVELVDRAVGQILDTLEATGLSEDTVVIHTSDHGHLFGEHGLQGKPTGILGKLYEPTVRTPLIIRHPDGVGAGRRVDALVQAPDINATILDFLGVPASKGHEGQSLLPLMGGEPGGREIAFSGRFTAEAASAVAAGFDGFAGLPTYEPLTVTTLEWSLIWPPAGSGYGPELYRLISDPSQRYNVIADHHDVARDLHARLIQFLTDHGMEPERLTSYQDYVPDRNGENLSGTDFPVHATSIEGRTYAYTDWDDAERCAAGIRLETVSASSLVGQTPPAMICVEDQYYWAEDLYGPR